VGPYTPGIRLTLAATTFQPSGKRTQLCIWRPILPGAELRRNSVEAVPKSRPKRCNHGAFEIALKADGGSGSPKGLDLG
jgi:hypothetical protein